MKKGHSIWNLKNFTKISEKDIKENLTPEQYQEYLENEKIDKLEEAKPYIKKIFFLLFNTFGQTLYRVLITELLIKNLMTSLRGKLNV